MIDERKNVQTTPTRTYCKRSMPLPYYNPIVGPSHHPTTPWMIVGQVPITLAVCAGGGCLDIFTLLYPSSPLSPSLWETARYRLKYCLKGPFNPKQPTNHPSILHPKIQPKISSGSEEEVDFVILAIFSNGGHLGYLT